MRLLLDTHAWIWLRYAPSQLPAALQGTLESAESVHVSLVAPWEIAIGQKVGKMAAVTDLPLDETRAGFPILPILPRHIAQLARLPLHHRDPFDRMLVAQAQVEGLVIVTADRVIRAYDVAVLPA